MGGVDLAGALAAPCLWSVGVQFEFSAWMSTTIGSPLPTTKGQIDLMASFPEVSATCHALVFFWGIPDETKDTVSKVQGGGGGGVGGGRVPRVPGEWVR